MLNHTPIKCVIMRGGTSKGVYFREDDLIEASYSRTARRLMEGTTYVSRSIMS